MDQCILLISLVAGKHSWLIDDVVSVLVIIARFLRSLVAQLDPTRQTELHKCTYLHCTNLVLPLSIITSHISQKFVTLAKFSFFSVL